LGGRFRELTATLGMSDTAVGQSAQFVITGDGKSLVTVTTRPGAARAVKVDLTGVAGPIGLVGGLLYYIGVVDAREYFGYFGVDYGLLGFSTADYISRSADAILPSSVVAVSAIMTLFFLQVLARRFPRLLRVGLGGPWVRRGLLVVAAITLAVGAVGFATTSGGAGWRLAFPVLIMVAVLLIESVGSTTDRPGSPAPARRLTVAVTVMLVGLVLIAGNSGQRARERAATDRALPAVVVFSEKDLAISGSGVAALKLTVVGGQYNFQYSGLRLLGRGNGGVLLLPDGWRPRDGNAILLREDATMRVDFTSPSAGGEGDY
jgi:hypothetical protein